MNSICVSIIFAILLLSCISITSSAKQQQQQKQPSTTAVPQACALSEFACNNGKCIPVAQFCDNVNNCGDSSDEPRFCTRCNRTYYGNVGVTYDLELHRPKEDKLPYICILTFTAAGGIHGDIVQVTLESFTLGKFLSYTQNGCEDGYLQISEALRQPIGGMWCGSSWGPAVFYSETRSLVMTVKLFKLSRDQSGYNFDFRMQYKVLSKDKSVVRYGGVKYEKILPWTNVSYTPNYPRFDDNNNSSTNYSIDHLNEIQSNNFNKSDRGRDRDNDRSMNKNKDSDKNRDDDRMRDRDRSKEFDRNRDDDRMRDRDRSKDYDRNRDDDRMRDRDRSKDYDRNNRDRNNNINRNKNINFDRNRDSNSNRNRGQNQNYDRSRDQFNYDRSRDQDYDRSRDRERDNEIYRNRDHHYDDSESDEHGDWNRERTNPLEWDRDRYQIKNSSNSYNRNSKMDRNRLDKRLNEVNYTEPIYYLGDLIPGTYCSRIFSNCDKKACRLQSPNFPGIYPRNLTCYYAVRQHDVPPGKHALITVKQPKGNLVWITTETSASATKNDKEKFKPKLNTWDECDNVQDYVTIYDGYTTRDPIILKFCGGGQAVPASTSSGPELLVEFTTSPYGTFINPQQFFNSLNGFQLEVSVEFVDVLSPSYAKSKRLCEFWVRGTGHGVLENPKHSIAPNTTCLYHLQGTEALSRSIDQLQVSLRRASSISTTATRFKIWLSVLKFDYGPKFGLTEETIQVLPTKEDCSGMLRIWDGQLREVPICKDLDCLVNEREIPQRLLRLGHNHTNVIARFCRGSIPRSCDHGVINDTDTRPCLFSESFISSSDYVTLELKVSESTVLRPLNFKIRYEFVDYIQDGLPIDTEHGCNRKFVSSLMEKRSEPTSFRSVRNVFYFGRGGARNLKCVYRFEGQRGERVRIVVRSMMAGNRSCDSRLDRDIGRTFCFGDNTAKLEIYEKPWQESIPFMRNCICNSTSNSSHLPLVYTSTSREVELHFLATNMTNNDDPDTLNFEATFEFFKSSQSCKDSRRRAGSEGEVILSLGDMECRPRPWLIEPSLGKYVYIRFRGLYLSRYNPLVQMPLNTTMRMYPPAQCSTRGRIVITTGEGVTITACPLPEDYSGTQTVEVFSAGWHTKNLFLQKEASPALSLEFLEPEDDGEDYAFTFLELTRKLPVAEGIEDCQYFCPELQACVNASTWCDGKVHCPSGYDESFTHCSAILRLPAEILAAICVVLLVLCCGLVTYVYKKLRKHCRRSSVLQTRLKSLSSMDTAVFDEKDFIS